MAGARKGNVIRTGGYIASGSYAPSDFVLGSGPRKVFVFVDRHGGGENVSNTIAHELGHALDLFHPDEFGDPDPDNLMHTTNGGEELRKNQWDILHQ